MSRQKKVAEHTRGWGREITVEALTQVALRLQAMGAGVRAKIGVGTCFDLTVSPSAFYRQKKPSTTYNRTPAQLEQMKDDYYALSNHGT